jgi:hypothetical protein
MAKGQTAVLARIEVEHRAELTLPPPPEPPPVPSPREPRTAERIIEALQMWLDQEA